MKILSIIREGLNDPQDAIVNPNTSSLISFKNLCVVNFANSIHKQSKSTHPPSIVTLEDFVGQPIDKSLRFLRLFDYIVVFSKRYPGFISSYFDSIPNKVIFLESPYIFREPLLYPRDQEFIRVMPWVVENYIQDLSTGLTRQGISFRPKAQVANRNKVILLIIQTVGDISISPTNPYEWALSILENLNTDYPGWEVIIKDHPLQDANYKGLTPEKLSIYSKLRISFFTGQLIEEALDLASITITFSSGVVVDSLLRGVPVITMDPRSPGYEITPHSLDKLDDLRLPKLDDFLSALSNSHFKHNELYNGTAWKTVKPFLK